MEAVERHLAQRTQELEAEKAAQVAIKVRLAKVKYCVSSGYKCNVLWRLVWCRHERNVNVM